LKVEPSYRTRTMELDSYNNLETLTSNRLVMEMMGDSHALRDASFTFEQGTYSFMKGYGSLSRDVMDAIFEDIAKDAPPDSKLVAPSDPASFGVLQSRYPALVQSPLAACLGGALEGIPAQ
jgi:hypothetical protein